jgi:hypothetical protein
VWDEDIIAIIGFFTTAIVICVPLVRGLVRRWDRKSIEPASSADTAARLERIENAIDAMAVEVERISEGQRFVTRLMSEQAQERMALPVRSDGR